MTVTNFPNGINTPFTITDITAAEAAAGVTPANYSYPAGDIRRYGAVDAALVPGSLSYTAIAAAISSNAVVFIPSGTWVTDTSIELPTNVSLVGEGINQSTIMWSYSAGLAGFDKGVVQTDAVALVFGIQIRELSISCNNVCDTALFIHGWQEQCGLWNVTLKESLSSPWIIGSGPVDNHAATFQDVRVWSSTSMVDTTIVPLIYIDDCRNCTFRRITASGIQSVASLMEYGLEVKAGAEDNTFESIHVEFCDVGILNQGDGNTFINVTSHHNATAGSGTTHFQDQSGEFALLNLYTYDNAGSTFTTHINHPRGSIATSAHDRTSFWLMGNNGTGYNISSSHLILREDSSGVDVLRQSDASLGFYNATPVVQPTAVADATDAATAISQLNLLLARVRTLGLIAT